MANLIGQTLLKQFRVDSFIASGGMGTVYRVWDLKRNVPLAMKLLHSELAEDPSIFNRFQREANALKKLAHPHIVPFYGLYQTMDFAFIIERFIDGPSLKEILKQKKNEPFSIEEALTYLKALSAALGYAHANGVVHCDVKPGNVMIDQGGNIYLTDFGVARHAESSNTTLGGAGTPAYMPPEQILGEPVTPATDVYALGVILFEMLAGRRPFRGQEFGTEKSGSTIYERIRYAHLHTPPPNPRTINPSIPEPLATVILKSLSKDPCERHSSAPEFFAAVCEAAGISPDNLGDRTVISDHPAKSNTTPVSHETHATSPRFITLLAQKIRSVSAFQVIGIITLVFFFCTLAAIPILRSSFALLAVPTGTSTYTATSISTQTTTPSPAPSPTPSIARFFTEEFNDSLQQYWKNFVITDNASDQNISVEDGFLNFSLNDSHLWTYLIYEPQVYEDVRISVRVENRGEKSGTLIVCNFTGKEWNEFRILTSGLYEISYQKFDLDGKHASQTRITNGGSANINLSHASNEYTAVCSRNKLTLYINGILTETVSSYRQILVEGKVGIGVFSDKLSPVTVGIDQVQIDQP